jgi:hypothetical protein
MLVELREIPFAGAPETLRSEAYLGRYAATTKGLPQAGETTQMGIFQQPVKRSGGWIRLL